MNDPFIAGGYDVDEPLGPGAFCPPDNKWTIYDIDFTLRWRGGRTIEIYDQARNFRLVEAWVFTNKNSPAMEEAQRAMRKRIRQYEEWQVKHKRDYLGDEDPTEFFIRLFHTTKGA